jgi:hypothetical protein
MKKIISVAVMLALLLLLVSGCGEKKALLGTWTCTADIPAQAQALLEQDYCVEDFSVPIRLSFFADNTFRLEADAEKLAGAVDTLEEELAENLMQLLQEQLAQKGLLLEIETILGMSGLEQDALTQKMMENFHGEAIEKTLSDQLKLTGFFRVKDDKLLLTADAEAKLEDTYILYTLEEGRLTFASYAGENALFTGHPVLGADPVTFTKIS